MPQDQHILEIPLRSWREFQELGGWWGGNWVTARRPVPTNAQGTERPAKEAGLQ